MTDIGTQAPALGSSTNPDIQVTGAPPPTPAPVQATAPGPMVPMIAPDGSKGSIPSNRISDAVRAGGKIAVNFVAPDGTKGLIPIDQVHQAINAGGHIDDPTVNALSDTSGLLGVASGAAKGVVDTMRGVSSLATGSPDALGIPAVPPVSGIAEKIGKAGESVLEFMLGDEALKGLSLGQKLEKIAPTIQAIEAHPALAKVVGGALTGGTVGGVEGAVKGAEGGNAGKGALEGAIVGGVAGAAIPAVEAVKNLRVNPFRAVANKLTGADIQPTLQNGIRDVWNKVAVAEDVPKPLPGISVGEAGEQVGDAILARSKAAYKQIDEATGGRFAKNDDDLRAVNREMRFVSNDIEEQNLMIRKTRLEMQHEQMFDEAEKKGVSQATVAAAKSDFRKAQAIYDTNAQIQLSTSGVRSGMKGSEAVPEEVNAKSMMNRMNKMYNKGRLQEGVGDDNSEDLIAHSAYAQKALRDVARNKKIATAAAIGVGASAIPKTWDTLSTPK